MSEQDKTKASFLAGAAVTVPDEYDVVVMSVRCVENPAQIESREQLDEIAESKHIAMAHDHAVQLRGLLDDAIAQLGSRLGENDDQDEEEG